jgi:hypothetical protein
MHFHFFGTSDFGIQKEMFYLTRFLPFPVYRFFHLVTIKVELVYILIALFRGTGSAEGITDICKLLTESRADDLSVIPLVFFATFNFALYRR